MTNNIVFKRFVAYCIDLLIISLLITLLSQVRFINPNRNKYKKAVEAYTQYSTELQEKMEDTSKIDSNTLINDEYVNLIYNIDYYGVSYTITELLVFICYFTILPFFNDGKTFGKEFLRIKVVNNDDTRVSFIKLLARSIFVPIYASIFLYTSIKSILLSIMVFCVEPWTYFYINGSITMMLAIYCYADVIIILASKSHLAVHDKIFRTKVINCVRTK